MFQVSESKETRRQVRTICGVLIAVLSLGALPVMAAHLSGRVVHSEFLDPIAPQEEIGQIFESTQLYKKMMACRNGKPRKFLIPSWLAGTWERKESTETSRIELPSGRRLQPRGSGVARVTDRFGTYQDSLGLIWQVFEPQHAAGSIDRGDSVDYHAVTDYQLISTGTNVAIVEVQACHAVVDKKTKKVTSAYQDEELNTYTSMGTDMGQNMVNTDSSVKVFSVGGKPLFLTKAVSLETKVAPFVPIMEPGQAASEQGR
jgi:hypothetical protein